MTGQLERGVHVAPGAGIVARIGSFVAFAEGDDDGLNQLIVRLNALADAPWPEVVRTLTSDIAAAGYSSHPLLACATVESDRVRTLVFGDLQLLVVTAADRQVLDGSDSSTWIDVAIRGEVSRLQCGHQHGSSVVGVLRDGVVPGGGFLFDTHAPIPAAVDWQPISPTVEPDAADSADEFIEIEAVPDRESVASVVDIEQYADRHDRAQSDDQTADIRTLHELVSSIDRATTESYPERSMFSRDDPIEHVVDDATQPAAPRYVITGERPTIGTLTFDDGASLQLTRPVVIGRGVPERYTIDGEAATTVLLDDTEGRISDVHLEVRLNGNIVELCDKGSGAGTYLHIVESDERVRLEPGVDTVIGPDTVVEIGQRSFTYTLPPPPTRTFDTGT